MKPLGMEDTPILHCRLAVVNRQGGVIVDFSWGLITARVKKSTNSEEHFITVCTASDTKFIAKYNLSGNIEDLFVQFLDKGRVTVSLKEPSYNIIMTKAHPKALKAFILHFMLQLPADSPVYATLAAFEPPIHQIRLKDHRRYRLRMKMIKRMNLNLDQCTKLEISFCNLELAGDQLPFADAIRNMKNLTTLRLKHINLSSSTFLEIESKELKRLYLCECKTELPTASLFKNDLCYKDSLVELRLEENKWSEVPNGIFQFRNLRKLSLTNNCITELPDKFTNLPKLQELSLSNNRLTHIPSSIFTLQNLRKLSLNGNQITELPDMFANLPKLQVLLLSINGIGHVPPSIFALQNLSQLYLNSNCISELPDKFANLPKLQELSLSDNQLTHLPSSIFELQDLTKFELDDNHISELPDMFANLPKLDKLSLSYNRIRHLPPSIFTLQNLSQLYFNLNFISELPDMFTNLSKLKVLTLSHNQLKFLPPSIFALHLTKLDIDDNEFDFEIPPPFDSELIVHSLKELSYRTILKHKLKVEEGMLPEKFLKDLRNYCQCVCGCKFVDEGQDVLFFCNLNDISNFNLYNDDPHLRVPIRGKMCTSLQSCFQDHFIYGKDNY